MADDPRMAGDVGGEDLDDLGEPDDIDALDDEDDDVDEAAEQSFPGSDAPARGGTT